METIKCRFCGAVISATAAECDSCGYGTPYGVSLEEEQEKEEAQVDKSLASPAKPNPISPRDSSAGTASQVSVLMTRYTDAYREARAIATIGKFIKWGGVAIALLLALVGFNFINDRGPDMYIRTGIGIGAIILGLIGGAIIFIIGVLVSAQGQTLKATLDSAVNNSPFLTNEHRARIMSLPRS